MQYSSVLTFGASFQNNYVKQLTIEQPLIKKSFLQCDIS